MIVCGNIGWYSEAILRPVMGEGLFFSKALHSDEPEECEAFEKEKKMELTRETAGNHAVEIRWHGRGGQGAKTACMLMAEAAFDSGKYVQGFPEYGPERQGAPITAYNRIADKPCKVHSNIYKPDYVVVVDETLLDSVDVTAGLSEDGAVIINSSRSAEELRPMLNGYKGQICTLNAKRISEDNLGRNYPNTPMLAAVVKISKVIEERQFVEDMKASFEHKFRHKPNVIEGNMRALKQTLREVKVG